MDAAYELVGPQMRGLQKLEHALERLDLRWEVIDTTARIACAAEAAGFLGTLGHTRGTFGTLAQEMVERIAATHLANRQRDLASRAQVAIDILVRNLFERTADVGFIATDGPLIALLDNPTAEGARALRERLAEYRVKYTVYDDILVLTTEGEPLLGLRARSASASARAAPPWWAELIGRDGYFERHGPSGWFAGEGEVLLYAHRVVSARGGACGAVVLRFDLASELASLFAGLTEGKDDLTLLLVDAGRRVVASNKPGQFAPGETLHAPNATALAQLLAHQGQEYLVEQRASRGYQGYQGPPWTAVALVRLDTAFRQGRSADGVAGGHGVADAGIEADDPRLRGIVARARSIQEDLTRVIWNGKLGGQGAAGTAAPIQAVYDQIGRAGHDTVAVFDGAIVEMRRLLMGGRRAEIGAHAALAVDIMDRNLYERANDCRWWALSEELAELLARAEGPDAPAAEAEAARILAHLNSLYTVYRRVALFDSRGRIVAASRDADTLPPGACLDADLVRRTMALRGAQAYCVSALAPGVLSDGVPAYVFCAAIRRGGGPDGTVLGGIALAFNGQEEFQAMLRDAAPDGTGAIGFFVDGSGRVVSSTHAGAAVGELLPFAPELLAGVRGAAPSAARTHLVDWQGCRYLAGVAPSAGYREFKRSDGYREDVFGVLLTPVAPVEASSADGTAGTGAGAAGVSGAAARYGVVACGGLQIALHSSQVVEAVSARRLVRVPGPAQLCGLLEHEHRGQTSVLPAYDTCRIAGQPALAQPAAAVAVVIRSGGRSLALLVDRLVGVIESDAVHAAPASVRHYAPWVTGILGEGDGAQPMVYVVDPDLFDPQMTPLPANLLDEDGQLTLPTAAS